jgi:uncharacterized OB-fold protein
MSNTPRDGEYDDLLDAIEAGDGYSLECPEGHSLLPPRRICPHCGSRELTETLLPDGGTVVSYTEIAAPTPDFADDAPYVTAIADFDGVRITGVLLDADGDRLELGTLVGLDVGESVTTGDRIVTFRLR